MASPENLLVDILAEVLRELPGSRFKIARPHFAAQIVEHFIPFKIGRTSALAAYPARKQDIVRAESALRRGIKANRILRTQIDIGFANLAHFFLFAKFRRAEFKGILLVLGENPHGHPIFAAEAVGNRNGVNDIGENRHNSS